MVGLLQALPNSRLYKRLGDEGRLRSRSTGDNTSAALNFEPRLDREFLLENYRRLMKRLYEPGAYYQRIRIFLGTHRIRGPHEVMTWRDMGALLKSLWFMGVIHRGRRFYWRLLIGTLMRHPSQVGSP